MILLFDIDGTLILSGGAGRRAFQRAFWELYRIPRAMEGYPPQGKTDYLIAAELIQRHLGRPPEPGEVERVIALYVRFLPQEVATSPGYRVLPGVREALEALSRQPGVLLGLATGNVREGARIKLARGGLNRYFSFGAFGETFVRREIVQRARKEGIRRARELGRNHARVIVVGDTPLDVQAAREAGAEAVIVRTGPSHHDELRAAKPDLLVETLQDPAFWAYLDLPVPDYGLEP